MKVFWISEVRRVALLTVWAVSLAAAEIPESIASSWEHYQSRRERILEDLRDDRIKRLEDVLEDCLRELEHKQSDEQRALLVALRDGCQAQLHFLRPEEEGEALANLPEAPRSLPEDFMELVQRVVADADDYDARNALRRYDHHFRRASRQLQTVLAGISDVPARFRLWEVLGGSDEPLPDLAPLLLQDLWRARHADAPSVRYVRYSAAKALATLQPDLDKVRLELLAMLHSPVLLCRINAADAIASYGEQAQKMVEALLEQFERDDTTAGRQATLVALAKLAPTQDVVLDVSLKALRSPDRRLSATGAAAVEELADEGGVRTDDLLPLVEDQNPTVRAAAITALAELDMDQRQRRGLLRQYLDAEEHCRVLRAWAQHFKQLPVRDLDEHLPRLRHWLALGDGGLRNQVIIQIGRMGAAARPAVDDLIPFLYDRSNRYAAIAALGRIGTPAERALPHLRHLKEAGVSTSTLDEAIAAIDP